MNTIYVGCAGWTVPSQHAARFPGEGSHLERYAAQLNAVEINSSFYRPHRPATYTRWAESVPADFRFSVKAPKAITHDSALKDLAGFREFCSGVNCLGPKLRMVLVQLPPSMQLDVAVVQAFFQAAHSETSADFVLEPRHATWFTPEADALLESLRVGRVAADPVLHPGAGEPGGWREAAYFRLHGSPRTYYSNYSEEYLAATAVQLKAAAQQSQQVWCIFDNTADAAAQANALSVRDTLARR